MKRVGIPEEFDQGPGVMLELIVMGKELQSIRASWINNACSRRIIQNCEPSIPLLISSTTSASCKSQLLNRMRASLNVGTCNIHARLPSACI